VTKKRAEIVRLILNNNVVVLSSGTGSGKTTQVPQYIAHESHKAKMRGKIVCTQPRVLAARVAERVAAEAGCKLGTQVGLKVRGKDKTSSETKLV
jgi:HrpA-like RNA helicase